MVLFVAKVPFVAQVVKVLKFSFKDFFVGFLLELGKCLYLCGVIQKMETMKKKEEHIIIEKQSDDIQKEVGKWLMDIAKYVATAVIISGFLGRFEQTWVMYAIGGSIIGVCMLLGIILFKRKP